MNQLQYFLEEQKAYYAEKLAAGAMVRLQDLKNMLDEKKPTSAILQKILDFNDRLIAVFCQLQIANIEGEIIRIIKKGEREHEKQFRDGLLDGWDVNHYLPPAAPPEDRYPADPPD